MLSKSSFIPEPIPSLFFIYQRLARDGLPLSGLSDDSIPMDAFAFFSSLVRRRLESPLDPYGQHANAAFLATIKWLEPNGNCAIGMN